MNLAYSEYQDLDAFYNLFARFGSLIYIRKHMSAKNECSYYENWGCKFFFDDKGSKNLFKIVCDALL